MENQDPNVVYDDQRPRTRALQQVVTKQQRKEVVSWIIEDARVNGETKIASRAVAAFPQYFCVLKHAAYCRAARWWKGRDGIISDDGVQEASCVQTDKRTVYRLKTKAGRGRKRSPWAQWLHGELLQHFERLRNAGVKFSMTNMKELAQHILLHADGEFNSTYIDPFDGKKVLDKITLSWVQKFMDSHNIVFLRQTGRLICSPAKELHIKKSVAYHLGILQRGFNSGTFNEDYTENVDETHFVINCDNGRTMGFRGDDNVKYADVVSGGEAMTMVIRITGGRRAQVETPFMIFSNNRRSYPIRGVPDNVPGVCYRTSPKGWMDKILFEQYFSEPRAFLGDPYGHPKNVWVDNCSSHNQSEALLETLRSKHTTLQYLPPCSTHLTQPADSFVISKIKDAWTMAWEAKKLEMINEGAWQDTMRSDGASSGKLLNPGKSFFLSLAAQSVAAINNQQDEDGISYARKAMIRCGLSLDVTGEWHIGQLYQDLQNTIHDHPLYFQGLEVPSIIPEE